MIRAVVAVCTFAAGGPAAAVTCENITHDGARYTVCEADAQTDDIRLFLDDDTGRVFGTFTALDTDLQASGERLAFAMNAGMYHDDRTPVGLFEDQRGERARIVTRAGPGNFGLLPNGVFCIGETGAQVHETLAFVAAAPDCIYASQSGPMLVINGDLHPRFLVDSTSRYVRNGVGTSADGQRVVFAMSRHPVTFHQFGRLFRDGLNIPNALYFDGNISRLYAPEIGRADAGFRMGPIVGVVVPDE